MNKVDNRHSASQRDKLKRKQALNQAFLQRYKLYEQTAEEQHLLAFSELGREMHQAGLPPENAVELHASAMQQLSADCQLSEKERILPLMEVIMTYGLNFRQQIQWQQEFSNAQFYRVLEALGHLVWITDQNLHMDYVNPAFASQFGNRHATERADNWGGLNPQACPQDMFVQLQQGKRWHGQITVETKNATVIVLDVTAFPIGLGGCQNSHYVFMAEDVTEKLIMQKQFSQSQRLSTLGELASGITHEFNNVMTIISGFAELIRDEEETEARQEYVNEILTAIDKGKNLNQQVLSFAAARSTEIKPVKLADLIRSLRQFIKTSVGKAITLEISAVPDIQVSITEQHLCQLLTNLCINAKHAIEQADKKAPGIIQINLIEGKTEPWLEIRVKDNGMGMSEQTRKQIFEPFFTTKDTGKGTGLGLALLHKLVLEYQGEVQVKTQLNLGTEFILHLPVIHRPQHCPKVKKVPVELLNHWVKSEKSEKRYE